MKVTNLKRIIKEDFSKDDQELIEKLSFVYNPMVEQLVEAFNNNIDFDNLNQQVKTITVSVNNQGVPKNVTEIKYLLKTQLKGIICISAQNTTDTTPITGAPFVSYSMNNGAIRINSITGLPPDKNFSLSLILLG